VLLVYKEIKVNKVYQVSPVLPELILLCRVQLELLDYEVQQV
jgi:hypothetical protein